MPPVPWPAIQTWMRQTSTIMGLAVLGGSVSSYLLEAATPRQAAAAAVTGLIAVAMREAGLAPTTVNNQTIKLQVKPDATAHTEGDKP